MIPKRFISLTTARPEITKSGVGFLGTSVADHVAAVVRQMHHADAQLVEDLKQPKFLLDGCPPLRQRDAVGGHVQAALAIFAGLFDVIRMSALTTKSRMKSVT